MLHVSGCVGVGVYINVGVYFAVGVYVGVGVYVNVGVYFAAGVGVGVVGIDRRAITPPHTVIDGTSPLTGAGIKIVKIVRLLARQEIHLL